MKRIISFSAILLGLVFMSVNIYNGLVSLKKQVERAWSNIDVILKQRFDEIPQLVQVIEQYAGYESSVLKNLSEARKSYGQTQNIHDKIEASQAMTVALKGIAAIGESYPELKSNQNFVQLQERISSLESTVADRREIYNESVTNFNTRIEQIPDVFVARFLNYKSFELYQVDPSEKARPNLKMNIPNVG